MTRVDDFLDLVDNPARHALTPGHPADDALLALLVHVAFSDGEVDDAELDFLQRVLPGRDRGQLAAWVAQVGATPLNIRAVAQALPTEDERWKGLRFAARMAWKDGTIEAEERSMLAGLARGLDLGLDAVDRVLAEMQGRVGDRVDPTRLAEAVDGVPWASVQILDEAVSGTIAEAAPRGVQLCRAVALDDVVVAALYAEGLSAHFLEGTAFVTWNDLVTYTRVSTMGAAVQLHTEDGRTWTLVDSRMRGLALVLDRLFGAQRARAPKPEVVQLRGEGIAPPDGDAAE